MTTHAHRHMLLVQRCHTCHIRKREYSGTLWTPRQNTGHYFLPRFWPASFADGRGLRGVRILGGFVPLVRFGGVRLFMFTFLLLTCPNRQQSQNVKTVPIMTVFR